MLGGPNGAGKTTAASVLLPEQVFIDQFVNADVIARGITPFAPEKSAIEAGRIMLKRMRDLRERRETFSFETTLSSRSFAPFLRKAKQMGYRVNVLYIWISNSEVCVNRVGVRVKQGGHHVPRETVLRRYDRGLVNFFELYMPLANSWLLCDNSGVETKRVAFGGADGPTAICEQETWLIIQKMAQQLTKTR